LSPDSGLGAQEGLGRRAVRGAFWNILFSILNKVSTLGAQWVLAWLLLPADFGLVALATSISSLMDVVSVSSLGNILVQETDEGRFRRDFGQVFWLINAINGALVLLTFAVAPWIGRAYGQPGLSPLLMLIAVNGLFTGLSLAHGSALQRSLKFKSLAFIFLVAGTLQSLASILLAWLGWGPYAILVPLALSSLAGMVLQVRAAGPLPLGRPRPGLWLGFLAPSFWLLFLDLLMALPGQCTSFIMGFGQGPAQIGIFFWGFSIANQLVFLTCANLRKVLFPTFAALNGQPERQAAALKRSLTMMTTALAYLCVLQAVTAGPLIALFFPGRWAGAAPVVSWISLGLLTQPLTMLYYSLMMARGEYRRVAANALVQGLLVVACASVGCLPEGSGPASAAAWTAMGYFAAGIYCGWELLAPYGKAWRSLAGLLAKPLLMALGCGLLGAGALRLAGPAALALQLGLGILVVTGSFALAIRFFDLESYRALRSRL
jgi:O-antigen/teichoic acid export membrane protein